jgi:hypothetical protein
MSTPREKQSFIVWIRPKIAESETARKAMRRWRESGATVITFVEQPMKTGRRRYSVCQTSVVIKSGSESLTSILYPKEISRKLRTRACHEGGEVPIRVNPVSAHPL